jgi:hypothetical protein
MQFGLLVVATTPADATKDGGHADGTEDQKPLGSIGQNVRALRSCQIPPPKAPARHGTEHTVRPAFRREAEIIVSLRVTYSSHDALVEVRDVRGDARSPCGPTAR